MNDKRRQAAWELVKWHFETEPDLQRVYVILGREGEPIRLLEVNEAAIRNDRFEAYAFAPTQDLPFPTAIAEVTPDELMRFQDTNALPAHWDLAQAEVIDRPKAA